MGIFKRLGLLLSSIAMLLVVAFILIVLTNYMNWGSYLINAIMYPVAWYILLALMAIAALFALITLLRAIFTQGKKRKLIAKRELGEIEISRSALENTVRRTIESQPGIISEYESVSVKSGSNPSMSVQARVAVDPDLSTPDAAGALQETIKHELERFTGVSVSSVDLQFFDPKVDQVKA